MAYVDRRRFTKSVLKRWEDIPDPRLREVMQSAIRHLHGFVSEVKPTGAEWFKAIEFLTAIGHKCDDKRQEFILASDVMGVSMLVDDINNRRVEGATPSTVEGPFHIPDAPEVAHGAGMAERAPGIPCFVSGTVRGLDGGRSRARCSTCGRPTARASTRSSAAPRSPGCAASTAAADGSYLIRTVAPISYTIPMDGPIGALMGRTDMSHMRPAHIHFAISAPGYHGWSRTCSRRATSTSTTTWSMA